LKKKPLIERTEVLATTRLFRVEQIALRFSNGVTAEYERLLGSDRGAVLIVPVLNEDDLLLIREYCAGTDRYELAFPKGRIDGQETVEHAANRELQEEVGFAARRLEHVHSVTLAPGYFGHRTHIVIAADLYPQRLEGDEPEPIEVVPWPLAEARDLLQCEDFTEARSIAALYMVLDRYGRRD
jgi:ADP-ribose diphosphatase